MFHQVKPITGFDTFILYKVIRFAGKVVSSMHSIAIHITLMRMKTKLDIVCETVNFKGYQQPYADFLITWIYIFINSVMLIYLCKADASKAVKVQQEKIATRACYELLSAVELKIFIFVLLDVGFSRYKITCIHVRPDGNYRCYLTRHAW